jgi:hypothetical protein
MNKKRKGGNGKMEEFELLIKYIKRKYRRE